MASKYHVKRESWGQRTARRRRAAERTEARAQRTDQAQLALLDTRRGESKRERARLEQRLASA